MPLMPSADEWSYAPPGDTLFGDVDVVRFYMQDTDSALRLLSDAELQYLIDVWYPKYDSLIYVSSVAADQVAAKFTGVVSVTADGVSVNVADLATNYAALAARLRQTHKDGQVGGEVDIDNLLMGLEPDYGIKPLAFGVGMHDNREAGRQDYGNQRDVYYEDTVRPGF